MGGSSSCAWIICAWPRSVYRLALGVNLFAANEIEDFRRFGDIAGLAENDDPPAEGPELHLAVGEEPGKLGFQLFQMGVRAADLLPAPRAR